MSLSLSGEYARLAGQAEAALRLFVADINAGGGLEAGGRRYRCALECHDDRSDPARAAEVYRWLCGEKRADLLFGPYSSRLARVAAPIAEGAGMVMVNHGGAGDQLYDRNYRMIVGVLSPASNYLTPFAALLGTLKFWRKRVAIIASKAPFAGDVALGFERACMERKVRRRGVRIRLKYTAAAADRVWDRLVPALRRSRINVLVAAGSFEEDVELMREVTSRDLSIPVLACVAAGVSEFGTALGEHAEGIVGPSGWEEEAEIEVELGPTPGEFARRMRAAYPGLRIDYPAAQAYAAGLLTAAAIKSAGSIDQHRLRAAFSDLRTRTLYGDFAIDRVTGRQVGHQMSLVQWHGGRKAIILSQAANLTTLQLPGILSSIGEGLRLMMEPSSRRDYDGDDP